MANTRAAIFISIALMMLAPLPARTANAQCEACTKLKRANVLGIKRAKEFLIRADQIKVFRSQNKAQSKGYFRYRSCLDPADVSVAARLPCAPVFGIISEKLYLCPAQLKRFRSVDQARRRGYSEHLECLNGIPNPQVTPLPSTYTFTPEAGERFADVDSFSILALAGGGYRNYSGASTSPFLPDTIRHSPSADGITFGALDVPPEM